MPRFLLHFFTTRVPWSNLELGLAMCQCARQQTQLPLVHTNEGLHVHPRGPYARAQVGPAAVRKWSRAQLRRLERNFRHPQLRVARQQLLELRWLLFREVVRLSQVIRSCQTTGHGESIVAVGCAVCRTSVGSALILNRQGRFEHGAGSLNVTP
jgi:hypothetical protein